MLGMKFCFWCFFGMHLFIVSPLILMVKAAKIPQHLETKHNLVVAIVPRILPFSESPGTESNSEWKVF